MSKASDSKTKDEEPVKIRALTRRGLAYARQAEQTSGWRRTVDLFREKDADGNRLGLLPYTVAGVRALEQWLARDPENHEALRHLAIARHCHAWDLELANDPRAATEWMQALECWRKIETNRDFWEARKARFLAFAGQGADTAWLDALRRDMMDQLLDIHADFICYYSEIGVPQRASAHVELVKRAKIPPVSRNRLLAKVMGVMTATVPDTRQRRAYGAALGAVDRFLAMFPDYMPALRLLMEVCEEWLGTLSYENDWPVILEIEGRCRGHAARFAGGANAGGELLGKAALSALGMRFCRMAVKKGLPYVRFLEGEGPEGLSQMEAAEAFRLGIEWGRLTCPHSAQGAPVRGWFAECAKGWAKVRRQAAQEILEREDQTGRLGAVPVFEDMLAVLREAAEVSPEDTATLQSGFIEPLEKDLTAIREL
jgi:hypothetical protein